MQRSKLPSLIIGVLLIVSMAGFVYAFSSSRCPPEQTTSALICHHPQAKYFVA